MSQATTSGSGQKRGSSENEKISTVTRSKSTKSGSRKIKELSQAEKERRNWKDFVRKYMEDLKTVKAVVDDTPPKLNISLLYDQETLKSEQKKIQSHYNVCPEIVRLLHNINVFGGRTETFAFDYQKLQPISNFNERRCEALRIQEANQFMKEMIETTQSRLPRVEEYAQFWKSMESFMQFNSQYPLFWKVKKKKKKETIEVGPSKTYFNQYVTEKSAKYPDKRPRVFFEISIRNVGAIGKMVAVLFSDYVPMTVKNFLAFCDSKAKLTYKGCFFYLIFQNFFCQTGDVVENRGFGGTSLYGPYFGDEDHTLQHGQRGILTMYQKIPNRNQCQFLITFRELKSLNGTNVVFGKIVKGFHVLDAIESVGSKKTGRPRVEIYISDCDEI